MTLRNSSGKFSLPSFGRKASGVHDGPASPSRTNGNPYDDPASPGREGNGFSLGNGGGEGFGRKLGKSIAHQSILPSLGNKEQRALQDVISSEKAVLQAAEKFGAETQKAAAALTPFGTQEGPDLQDILTHSSTLLNQLGTAFAVFTDHSANLRTCYKRIREREEALDELRRRRRATGAKAESAEKKLAKMGPENKQLPSQTELLERLRGDMRQMDTDIVTEESKIGDFKRQQVKEALSYKFGGLEELGEKMCIIGELGKLLLEEVPLEVTPPGYGRAPYLGYAKTESAVNEATKCLATVKFSAGSANPKPPGLPPHNPSERLHTPQLPHSHDIAAAEEFAHYPGGADAASPQAALRGQRQDYGLDSSDPYGGLSNPYEQRQDHAYSDFGGTRGGNEPHVMFQGPSDEHIQSDGAGRPSGGHDYEYEQQKQLDEEERAWRETQPNLATQHGALAPAITTDPATDGPTQNPEPHAEGSGLNVPWEPLKVNKDRAATPTSLRDAAPRSDVPDMGEDIAGGSTSHYVHSPTSIDLPPPPAIGALSAAGGPPTPSEQGGFYTPPEGTTPEPIYPTTVPSQPAPPAPIPVPPPVVRDYTSAPGSGKISAAAFRRGAKRSTDTEDIGSPVNQESSPEGVARAPRRLPPPPTGIPGGFGRPQTPIEAGFELPHPPVVGGSKRTSEAYEDATAEEMPPPQYHPNGQNSESLR